MFGLSFYEFLVIAVVAVLVFGARLPQVAAEAAAFVGKMRRSLTELRRETGIDREIASARRAIETNVPREVRNFDVRKSVKDNLRKMGSDAVAPVRDELQEASSAAREAQRDLEQGIREASERAIAAGESDGNEAGEPQPSEESGEIRTSPPEERTE